MGFWAALLHSFHLILPAVVLAPVLWLGGLFLRQKQAQSLVWWAQIAVNFIVGCAALLASLLLLGHDGKMATYAALVLASATGQWVGMGGWRR